jgi:hypothetical protein
MDGKKEKQQPTLKMGISRLSMHPRAAGLRVTIANPDDTYNFARVSNGNG